MNVRSKARLKRVTSMLHRIVHIFLYCITTLSVLLVVTLILGEYVTYKDYYTKEHNFFSQEIRPNHNSVTENITYPNRIRTFLRQASHDRVPVTQYEIKKGFVSSRLVPKEQDSNILALDTDSSVITVSGGMSIEKLQHELEVYNLTLPVITPFMGAKVSDIIAANAYASDMRTTFGGDVLRSFRLLTPDGNVLNVSRAENPELFKLTLGGQGLFGIVLDADFKVSENVSLTKNEYTVPYALFPQFFYSTVYAHKETPLFMASAISRDGVLPKKLIATSWSIKDVTVLPEEKKSLGMQMLEVAEKHVPLSGLVSRFSFLKENKVLSASNLHKSEVLTTIGTHFTSKELDTHEVTTSSTYSYSIPVRNFIPFMNQLYLLTDTSQLAIKSLSIMYSPLSRDALLTPNQKEDSFIISFTDVREVTDTRTDEMVEATHKQLTKTVITLGGAQSFFNDYYPLFNDLEKEYPNLMTFLAKKKEYDPQGLFVNTWYLNYK